ncbi:protein phosphatase 1B-like [Chiloscyllium plagiosum]|uniref:protein phosphatase 1B-like n=1 Tax=Chiloscyllium plagiosum TaxID=36176 RepID=UPI001CB85DA7|nr:protein phosphatase 1B-like [Chiloscyllium plagiosum]
MLKPSEEGIPDLVHVMRTLSMENIPNLPPGGGLASKRSVIEAVYNRLNPHRDDDGDPTGADQRGTRPGKLLETLRQLRINHRGSYRHLMEEMLASYRLAQIQGEANTTEQAASSAVMPARESETRLQADETRPDDVH